MISVVYSCMNREQNLIESIESWISVPNITEFIVVDWSSSSPLIHNNQIKQLSQNINLKILRVNKEKFFSLPRSYNLGISYVSNNIILKLDSDYKNINHSWMNHLVITDTNELKNFFIVGDWLFAKSLNGFMLVNKKDFKMYNENLSGWGYDDNDLYNRIVASNKYLRKVIFFDITKYIYHIPHSEDDRTSNYEIKDKLVSLKNNHNIANNKFEIAKYETIYEEYNYVELERI